MSPACKRGRRRGGASGTGEGAGPGQNFGVGVGGGGGDLAGVRSACVFVSSRPLSAEPGPEHTGCPTAFPSQCLHRMDGSA